MDEKIPAANAPDPESREHRDARVSVIAGTGFALAAGLVVVLILLTGFQRWQHAREDRRAPLAEPRTEVRVAPPGPALEVSPGRDLQALRRREAAELSTFGWVDRARGVCRIPIRLAIHRLAERGLPAAPVEQGGD